MSMNLHLEDEVGRRQLRLWQMPTFITAMCLVSGSGMHDETDTLSIMYRYIEWVKGQLNGSYASSEELESRRSLVNGHIQEVERFVRRSAKKPRFYKM